MPARLDAIAAERARRRARSSRAALSGPVARRDRFTQTLKEEEESMALPVRQTEPRSPLATPSAVSGRWSPARELEELHERMDQLMEDLWSAPAPNGDRLWSPLVDIEETEDAWIIEAEVPGAKRKDVDVEVRDSELSISGEIKERERKGLLRRRLRRKGRFDYRVTLPGGADPEGIDASLNDGVLTVRVPKPEQARPRRIEVKG
jgi:HSP20 family protein